MKMSETDTLTLRLMLTYMIVVACTIGAVDLNPMYWAAVVFAAGYGILYVRGDL